MSKSNNNIALKIIEDDADFASLREDWNDLLRESESDNIFLTWEWLYTWWQHFKKNKRLFIILAEEDGKLIGIAPLYVTKVIFFGMRPLRHIEFIGSFDSSSEYLDFILLKGKEKELIYSILDKIYSLPELKWDVLNFVSIKEESKNVDLLKLYTRENKCKFYIYNIRESPFIRLPKSIEEYYKSLSSDTRYKFRHYKKILIQNYSVTLCSMESNDLENSFDTFISLHQKRWLAKGGKGSFAANRQNYVDFHRHIVHLFHKKKWLYLTFLKINNEPVAAQYNFVYKDKLFCFQQGFDPNMEKYRVGSVLQLMVLENAIEKGIIEFDFLRGGEKYKYYWTRDKRKNFDIVIWKSEINSKIVKFEKLIRRSVKYLLPENLTTKCYERLFNRN